MPLCKITAPEVTAMRWMREEAGLTYSFIGRSFGVYPGTVKSALYSRKLPLNNSNTSQIVAKLRLIADQLEKNHEQPNTPARP